jgi:hypothetical protein
VPGRRPIGWDPTDDCVNIVYVVFTYGEKPRSGYYLLRGFNSFENESPEGLSRMFDCTITFLGSTSYSQWGFDFVDFEDETNDWNI